MISQELRSTTSDTQGLRVQERSVGLLRYPHGYINAISSSIDKKSLSVRRPGFGGFGGGGFGGGRGGGGGFPGLRNAHFGATGTEFELERPS